MTSIIWNLASFIVALGILVAVHEFGHFWVARRCGVKVEKFSIGFGKSIWSRKAKDGVEYTIAMIPLGGFVKMLDSRVDDVPDEQKHLAFDHKSLWRRSAIVAAGPAFNFLFAILAYWLVFMIGVPALKPVIGDVAPSSIASKAGITSGMELKSISGIETSDWESAHMALISHIGDKQIVLKVTSPQDVGIETSITLDTQDWSFDPETDSVMQTLGFQPYRPALTMVISNVSKDSAAEQAGFKVGDRLLAINNKPVTQWQAFVDAVKFSPEKMLNLQIERNGQQQTVALIPRSKTLTDGTKIGFAGIAPSMESWPEEYRFEQKYGIFASIPKAINKTGQIIDLTITMVKKLFTGDVGINNLSGPITIAKGAGATADYGLVYFLGFLALISVNLGIINLMPLPVLDGGHLLFFAIEAIIRRPVPEKVQEIGYRIGSTAIFALMLIAIFNDFARL
ncbi:MULTISPECIES: sigma E protease regulator RseP [Vibrio]|uniref:Zinc metalloprotease n=1 Tax=Vibrio algicola TaxID=2662262 RepID=A0A5Q0THU6_9VIBR|nr:MULTISPECIES: sigma E protease regulator RseP [Vibrio]MBD1575076.1 sigma E protease regulator RseP [Vibrio sp. S11_S32]